MDTNRKGKHQKGGGIRRYIKILATFIIVLIGITALSSNTAEVSAQTQTATGLSGTVRWTVYSDGLLEFKPNKGSSGTLANISTTTTTRPWSSYKNSVTKIKFQSGVRSSTNLFDMFNGMNRVTTIDFGNFNTSRATNMGQMFAGMTSLTSLDLRGFDTRNVTNMRLMFSFTQRMTSINLSSFNTAKVTSMHGMFQQANSLTTLDLRNFNTANVTDMAYMFSVTNNLRSLNISSFNTAKVTNMSAMFQNNSSLTSLNLSHFNTANVTDMAMMFSQSSSLTSLLVTNFNTLKVTNMNGMFQGLSNLTSLNLSTFNTQNVTNMAYMFNQTFKLQTIQLNRFNTTKVTTMYSMFRDNSLTELDLKHFNTANVTDMGFMFYGSSELETLDISSFNTNKVTSMSQTFSRMNNLKKIHLGVNFRFKTGHSFSSRPSGTSPEGLQYTGMWKHIDGKVHAADPEPALEPYYLGQVYDNTVAGWWIADTEETRIDWGYLDGVIWEILPDNTLNFRPRNGIHGVMWNVYSTESTRPWIAYKDVVTKITFQSGVQANSYLFDMFNGMNKVTTVDFGNFDTRNTTSMGQMFTGMSSLETLDLRVFNTNNVTDMRSMFNGMSSLKTLNISSFNTTNVTLMNSMFSGNSSIESLNLGHFNTTNVTNMGWMFNGMSSLKTLNISNFNTTNVTTMIAMFQNVSSLENLDLRHFNTANVTSMRSMFGNMTSIKNLNISTFNTEKVTDMRMMFQNLKLVASLDLRGFNTSAVTDMGWMFYNTNTLTTLDVSSFNTANVTDMMRMFNGVSKITSLNLSGFNTSKVTNMQGMFTSNSQLRTLDLSSFDTRYVTDMSYMFTSLRNLETLNIGNFNTGNVADMTDMFNNTPNLRSINLGANFRFKSGHGFTTTPFGVSPEGMLYTGLWKHRDGKVHASYPTTKAFSSTVLANIYNNTVSGWWDADVNDTRIDHGTLNGVIWEILEDNTLNFRPKNGIHGIMWELGSADSTRPWVKYKDIVTKVTFQSGVQAGTSLHYMFKDMNKVRTIDFGNFDTRNTTNMIQMFANNNSLTTLDLRALDTSRVTSMYGMFFGTNSLTSINLSNFNTANVTDMGLMFAGASSLGTLDLSRFNTSKVIYMNGMFQNVSSLTTLNLGIFSTMNVTDMSSMFNGMTSLINLNISTFNTARVTTMNAMFQNVSSLTTLNLGHFNTGNVTDMSFMFNGMNSVTTLGVGSFNTAKVTTMSAMFQAVHNLAALDLGHFNTGNVTTMSHMFNDARSLTTLNVTGFDTRKVTTMSTMFQNTHNLTALDLSSFNTVNVTNMGYMFNWARSLSSLNVSSFNTTNVTDMQRMFNGTNLTHLDIKHFNTSKVTNMFAMLSGNSKLVELDLGNFDTRQVTDMSFMFNLNSSMESLNIGNFNTQNVAAMNNMLNGLDSLKQINIGPNFRFKAGHLFNAKPVGTDLTGRAYTGLWKHKDGKVHSSNTSKKAYLAADLANTFDNTIAGWWVADTTSEYTVNFNSQGGSAVASVTVVEGGTIAVPGSNRLINVPIYRTDGQGVFTRDGSGNKIVNKTEPRQFFVLDGWYTQPNGQGVKLTTGTVIDSDRTYHANWKAVPITYQNKDQTKYLYTDFNYNGHRVTGLSAQGLAKFVNGDRLYLPDYNPETGVLITEIGTQAFRHIGFSGEVNLPNIEIIGSRAFERASGAAQSFTGNLYTVNASIVGSYAFFNQQFNQQLSAQQATSIEAYAYGNVPFKVIYLQRVQTIGTQAFTNLSNAAIYVNANNLPLFDTSHFGASSVDNIVYQPDASYFSNNPTRFIVNPIGLSARLRENKTNKSLGADVTIQTAHAKHNFFERDRKPYQFSAPAIPGYTPVSVNISTNTQVTDVYYTQNTVVERETITTPFKTKYDVVMNDPTLTTGQQRETVAGRDGKQVIEREWIELENGTKGNLIRETVVETVDVVNRVVQIHPTYTEVKINPPAPVRINNPAITVGQEVVRRTPQSGIRRDYLLPDGTIYSVITQQPVQGIIEVGTKPLNEVSVVEYTVEEIIPYQTRVVNSANYDIFFRQVTTPGKNGRKYVMYSQEYVNGEKKGQPKYIREMVIEQPVTEIITQGTKTGLGF